MTVKDIIKSKLITKNHTTIIYFDNGDSIEITFYELKKRLELLNKTVQNFNFDNGDDSTFSHPEITIQLQ